MTIHIESLSFDVVIGLLDFERITPQKVVLDIEISYDYTPNSFINYADVASCVEADLKKHQYLLLEDALIGLKTLLCMEYQSIQKIYIKLSKPDILPHCNVALSHQWIF